MNISTVYHYTKGTIITGKTEYYFQEWEGDTHQAHPDLPNERRLDKYNPNLQFEMGHRDRNLKAIYATTPRKFQVSVSTKEDSKIYNLSYGTAISVSTDPSTFTAWYITYQTDWLPTCSKSPDLYLRPSESSMPRSVIALYSLIDVHCEKCTLNGSRETQVNIMEEYEIRADRLLDSNQRIDDWKITGPAELVWANEDLSIIRIKTDYDGKNNSTPIKVEPVINTYTGFTVKLYVAVKETGETYLYDTITTTSYESIFDAPIAPENTVFLGWYMDTKTFGVVTDTEKNTSARISSNHRCKLKVDKDMSITTVYSKIPDNSKGKYSLTITGWNDDHITDNFETRFYYNGYLKTGPHTFGIYEVGSEIQLVFGTSTLAPVNVLKWTGDTQYITNSVWENRNITITMPNKDIHLHAVLTSFGGPYDFRREVRVLGGIARESYTDNQGPTIYVLAGTSTYVHPSETSVPNFVYDHMIVNHRYPDGDVQSEPIPLPVPFNSKTGVKINKYMYDSPDIPAHDIEVYLYRRHVLEFTVYTKNAIGPGTVYAGTYPIAGNLIDNDDERYQFNGWICKDINGEDQSDCVGDVNQLVTTITLSDRNLYLTADYAIWYKLIVINGQDSGTGHYSAGTIINTVTANDPTSDTQIFDHWDDPVGVIEDIYDPTPTIIMKDSIATITAVYANIGEITNNSILITDKQLTEEIMLRDDLNTVSGVATIGTLVFDKDGSIGVITNSNEDQLDDTRDYTIKKLFYGDDVTWLTI